MIRQNTSLSGKLFHDYYDFDVNRNQNFQQNKYFLVALSVENVFEVIVIKIGCNNLFDEQFESKSSK
jgi:hypothetical protein